MNIQGFYEVFACQVSQPVSPVSGVDSVLCVPWPRVPRSMMCGHWSWDSWCGLCGQCKWSVIGSWVSDKRLPATKMVITGPWWQGNWTQVDRTSLFLIETEIQRLCLITAPWQSAPSASSPPTTHRRLWVWDCENVIQSREVRENRKHTTWVRLSITSVT